MCMKPQKQQKNIIHSDIRNILNPVSILFWTRIGTLPSVDSRVTSVNQPLTPTSSSVLAIIDIPRFDELVGIDILSDLCKYD